MKMDKYGGLGLPKVRKQGVAAVGLSALVAVIIGCGGSGGSSSSGGGGGTAPTGTAAVRTSSIASVQTLNAGVAFPFAALQDTAPSGSGIAMMASLRKALTRGGTLTYVPALNLYVSDPTGTGSVRTVSYFTDAAGTTPAGSMTLTAAQGVFDFTSYSATIKVDVNVTAGNLPCNGTASIVFKDKAANNQLTGTLNLPKNKEQISVNLSLTDAGQVSGTMKIVEADTTLSVTNVNGPVSGTQTCDFTMSPQGYAGTGTINLDKATVSLQFTNPSGATSSVDTSGNLNIQYPGGSKETITNPVSTLLSGVVGTTGSTSSAGGTGSTSTSGGTGTTATGNATFAAPVLTQWAEQGRTGYALGGSDKSGEVVGTDQIQGNPVFAASVTSTVQVLDNNGQGGAANAINSKRAIVGFIAGIPQQPVYWSSPTAKAAILKLPAGLSYSTASGINDSGEIVGSGMAQGGTVYGIYWSSPTATPVTYTIPIETGSPRIDKLGHTFVASEFGVGYVYPGHSTGSVLAPLNPSSGNKAGVSGNGAFSNAGVVGASATFAYLGVATEWPATSYAPQALPVPGGFPQSGANAINDAGESTGWFKASLDSAFHLAFWQPGKTAVDLNSLFPSKVVPVQGVAMLNDGSLITTTQTAGANYFLKRK